MKEKLIEQVLKKLEEKERELVGLIKDLEERRNDAPTRNESRYDSSRAELQYSINAYARQLEEVRDTIEKIKSLGQEKTDRIDVGSFVRLSMGLTLLILPGAGGEKVEHNGEKVMVITPASPVFGILKGRKKGEEVVLLNGNRVVIEEVE